MKLNQDTTEPRKCNKARDTFAALDLRREGKSYREIAAALGISVSTAYLDVSDALAKLEAECAEKAAEVRKLEVERLDAMLDGLWQDASTGDPRKVEAALKIMDRRAKLLGLDAPLKSEVTGADGGPITIDDARAIFAQNLAKLARTADTGSAQESADGSSEPDPK